MNIIILLFALLILAALLIHLFKPQREECHNADEPKPAPTIDEAAAAEVAAMKPQAAPKGISEEEIREKTSVGLTRDQAIEVIKNQRAHDAALAKDAKAKK